MLEEGSAFDLIRVSEADRNSSIPLHILVSTRIQEAIESGRVPVGSTLENEVDLARRLTVSRSTMRHALHHLVQGGLLVRAPGRGTTVVHPPVRRPVELSSLFDDLTKAGRRPRTKVRSLRVVPASDTTSQLLGIPPRTPILEIERIRYTANVPLALMFNAVPCEVLDVAERDLAGHGLYELLRAAGAIPRLANQVIGARLADLDEAKTLDVERGAALLTMTRTAWDERARVIDYGFHLYRADRYAFELTVHGD